MIFVFDLFKVSSIYYEKKDLEFTIYVLYWKINEIIKEWSNPIYERKLLLYHLMQSLISSVVKYIILENEKLSSFARKCEKK